MPAPTRNIARAYEKLTPAWSTAQRPRRGADEGSKCGRRDLPIRFVLIIINY